MRAINLGRPWNCRLIWSDGIIADSMRRISLFAKGNLRNDAIGVAILGGIVGGMLGVRGEATLSEMLLVTSLWVVMGAAAGAIMGATLRGFGGALLGLLGGVVLGVSQGDFKWVVPAVFAGPVVGALAGPIVGATLTTLRDAVRKHPNKGA